MNQGRNLKKKKKRIRLKKIKYNKTMAGYTRKQNTELGLMKQRDENRILGTMQVDGKIAQE